MKKKTMLTKMHIAPSTVRYDAVAARDSNEVGQILAGTRKRNGYSLVAFSELLRHYGVEKVAEYEMDLIASRRYQPDAEEPAEIDYIMMPVSELPVSAGLGAFLEGEMFQQIQVPASSVPAGAEFGIYVSGDSMEPRYHSGQIVWVKRCEELECGDIGIFVYDDCGYLKKYDEHTPDKSQAEFLTDSYGVVHNQPVLVSLNTKYSPILISPEQRFEIVGKVLN